MPFIIIGKNLVFFDFLLKIPCKNRLQYNKFQ
jgi:hypothetical protein